MNTPCEDCVNAAFAVDLSSELGQSPFEVVPPPQTMEPASTECVPLVSECVPQEHRSAPIGLEISNSDKDRGTEEGVPPLLGPLVSLAPRALPFTCMSQAQEGEGLERQPPLPGVLSRRTQG